MIEDVGNRVQVRVNGSGTTTVVVAGNNGVSGIAGVNETVVGAAISQIFWSSDAAVTVARGSNTIFSLPAGTDHWNFRANGFSFEEYPGATLVITTTSANSTVIAELTKKV